MEPARIGLRARENKKMSGMHRCSGILNAAAIANLLKPLTAHKCGNFYTRMKCHVWQ